MFASTCTKTKQTALSARMTCFITTIQKPVSANVRALARTAEDHKFICPIRPARVHAKDPCYVRMGTTGIKKSAVASVYRNVAPGHPYQGVVVVEKDTKNDQLLSLILQKNS